MMYAKFEILLLAIQAKDNTYESQRPNVQFEFQAVEGRHVLVTGIVDKFTKLGTDG